MKIFILLSSLVVIVSCSNDSDHKQPEIPVTKSPTSNSQYTSPASDTGSAITHVTTPQEPVFPIGTYKTLPEIMKNLFSEGSTKNEVRNVQGKPDMIEQIDLYRETWYYGDCEVHFKGQLVKGVVKDNKNIKYASLYGTLMFSPDETESNLAHFLNDRIMR